MQHTKSEVELSINNYLHENLFAGLKKKFTDVQKAKLINSAEYKAKNPSEAKSLLDKSYKAWFDALSNFYLSYKTLFAVIPLVERELQIREFVTSEVIRVKADYSFGSIDFSAVYPAHFTNDMQKEVEDCINYIKNPKYAHIVSSYVSVTDTEKSPQNPLTNAELKYSCFYLFGFSPDYVSKLADMLFKCGLITNPKTSGWNIDYAIAEDIITVLNQVYEPYKVLQYKRSFPEKENSKRSTAECIRPTKITTEYFPKRIEETPEFSRFKRELPQIQVDLVKLYNFIFYITLSTQMNNSIYDTSKIEITVGNKVLKEEAYCVIEGQENWEELTGNTFKKIASNANLFNSQTVVLPEVAPETQLFPKDVYSYSYQSKRPPRYGVGRFLTQILEKNEIGENDEHDLIIEELISSNSVAIVKNMIVPQDTIVSMVSWMKENMNYFLEMENLSELEEKIESVANGSWPLKNLLDEFETMIAVAFEKSGVYFEDKEPSPAKVKLARAVARKNGLELDETTLKSTVKIDMLLAKYPLPEQVKVGRCPSCNDIVYEREYINESDGSVTNYYACEAYKKTCNFSIGSNSLYKFFSSKGIELFTNEERAETIKKILSKKTGYLFNGFVSKAQKNYDAKVTTEEYFDEKSQQKRWRLALLFNDKKGK